MSLKPIGAGLILLAGLACSCSNAITGKSVAIVPGPSEEGTGRGEQEYLKALAKIQENDCPSCHAWERKSVGPSYSEVAAKYEQTDEAVEMLAERIISGSVGVWGKIPMTAHPELSREDAEQMVKFVFTLKK